MALLLEQVKKLYDAGLLSNIRITVGFYRLKVKLLYKMYSTFGYL